MHSVLSFLWTIVYKYNIRFKSESQMLTQSIESLSLTELRELRSKRVSQYRLQRVDEIIEWLEECKSKYIPNLDNSSIESILTDIKDRPLDEWKDILTSEFESYFEQFDSSSWCDNSVREGIEIMADRLFDEDEDYWVEDEEHRYLNNYIRLLERTQ